MGCDARKTAETSPPPCHHQQRISPYRPIINNTATRAMSSIRAHKPKPSTPSDAQAQAPAPTQPSVQPYAYTTWTATWTARLGSRPTSKILHITTTSAPLLMTALLMFKHNTNLADNNYHLSSTKYLLFYQALILILSIYISWKLPRSIFASANHSQLKATTSTKQPRHHHWKTPTFLNNNDDNYYVPSLTSSSSPSEDDYPSPKTKTMSSKTSQNKAARQTSTSSTKSSSSESNYYSNSYYSAQETASWCLPNAIDIEDEDITFDGQPLSALFEQTRYSYSPEREVRDERRGRSLRRSER